MACLQTMRLFDTKILVTLQRTITVLRCSVSAIFSFVHSLQHRRFSSGFVHSFPSTYLNATDLLHKYTDSSSMTVLVEWPMGGNQHADHTSGYSSLVEFRQSADVAAQPKLGL